MEKFLSKGDIFFDVGSNLGQYIFRFREFDNSSLKIFAFEPVLSNYNIVNRRIKGNKNVVLENLALSDKNDYSVLFIPLLDGIEIDTQASLNLENRQMYYRNFKKQEIKVTMLDEYCNAHGITNIDLLKIDTEGNDDKVIKGGDLIINNSRPIIMAEDILDSDVFYLLQDKGYKPYYADNKWLLHHYKSEAPGLIKDLTVMVPDTRMNLLKGIIVSE
jgi:FkbM family methyltransferase